jgi:hypothetical protein
MAGKGRKRQRARPWQTAEPRSAPDLGQRRGTECGTKVAHANRVAAEQAAIEHEHRFGEAKGV